VERLNHQDQKSTTGGKKTGSILRIITTTRFGPAMHITTGSTFEVLKLCNGKINGWQFLNALNASGVTKYEEASACKLLAWLRRLSIVNLHSSPVGI
jgi:hypothetical protein